MFKKPVPLYLTAVDIVAITIVAVLLSIALLFHYLLEEFLKHSGQLAISNLKLPSSLITNFVLRQLLMNDDIDDLLLCSHIIYYFLLGTINRI